MDQEKKIKIDPQIIQASNKAYIQLINQQANTLYDQQLFEHFYRSRSLYTLRNYRFSLNLFEAYLEAAQVFSLDLYHHVQDWQGIEYGLVGLFIEELHLKGYALGTVKLVLNTIKVYARLAARGGVILQGDLLKILEIECSVQKVSQTEKKQIKRFKKGAPNFLSEEQFSSLINRIDLQHMNGTRDVAIFYLFFELGLRLGELVLLNREDYDAISRQLTITRTKVGLVQTHLLSERAGATLDSYLEKLPPTREEALFVNLRRTQYYLKRLSHRGVQKLFDRVQAHIGLKDFSPHDLRHSWATNAVARGIDLDQLREAGGWASYKMPLAYLAKRKIANLGLYEA
jgi:integrase